MRKFESSAIKTIWAQWREDKMTEKIKIVMLFTLNQITSEPPHQEDEIGVTRSVLKRERSKEQKTPVTKPERYRPFAKSRDISEFFIKSDSLV